MEIITTQHELRRLAQRLGVREDWHEPDEQCLTARVEGKSFDNAGFWPTPTNFPINSERAESVEQHVIFSTYQWDDDGNMVDITDIAAVNLATLCAWAASSYDNGQEF